MSLIAIRDRALEVALTQLGVREEWGNNRGPQVERYLAAVGLGPGEPWCCAFVLWCYVQATVDVGQGLELPLRRTGKCARLWSKTPAQWKSDRPSVGAIMIHLDDPTDPDTDGHVGIVHEFSDRTVAAVEGNTNAAGSRVGDRVRMNLRRREYVTGYIDIGREGPAPAALVA